jgi:hypothetical protein
MSENYVKNDELLKEIIIFKSVGHASEQLGMMLMKIAAHYSSKGSFSGYTWVSDMRSDAVLTCLKYLKNFDPQKSSNAFAYVTQICKNAFKAFIKNQNKHGEIKDICYNSYQNFIDNQGESYMRKAIDYERIRISFPSEEELPVPEIVEAIVEKLE